MPQLQHLLRQQNGCCVSQSVDFPSAVITLTQKLCSGCQGCLVERCIHLQDLHQATPDSLLECRCQARPCQACCNHRCAV